MNNSRTDRLLRSSFMLLHVTKANKNSYEHSILNYIHSHKGHNDDFSNIHSRLCHLFYWHRVFHLERQTSAKKDPPTDIVSILTLTMLNFGLAPFVAFGALALNGILVDDLSIAIPESMSWAFIMIITRIFFEAVYYFIRKRRKKDDLTKGFWGCMISTGTFASISV